MKLATAVAAAAIALAAPALALAQTAYSAQCKDGTTWSGKIKFGACTGHKGVASWTAAATTAASPAPSVTKPTLFKTTSTPTPAAKAVAPGGASQVWVNTKSKVYHCPSDPYYGKTKTGQYMTEAAAKAAGAHADHGKACS